MWCYPFRTVWCSRADSLGSQLNQNAQYTFFFARFIGEKGNSRLLREENPQNRHHNRTMKERWNNSFEKSRPFRPDIFRPWNLALPSSFLGFFSMLFLAVDTFGDTLCIGHPPSVGHSGEIRGKCRAVSLGSGSFDAAKKRFSPEALCTFTCMDGFQTFTQQSYGFHVFELPHVHVIFTVALKLLHHSNDTSREA